MQEASIDVDTTRLSEVILSLQRALGEAGQPADLSDILRDETRRLVVQITKLTPPQTATIGKKAVTRDINRLFSGADPELIDTIGDEHGVANIDTFITKRDGTKLRLKWDRIDPLGAQMAALHNAARDKRGHVPSRKEGPQNEWRARVIVPVDEKAKYTKKMLAHVGRWKASWAETAAKLGVSNIASWISQHFPSPNSITQTSGLMNGDYPSVTFGSRSPGIRDQRHVIESAVRIRSEAITKRVKLILSGYSKEISQGMKVTAKEKRSGQGGNYSIG